MADNICPLCGKKLKNGYCSECGGNMDTVCDAAESNEAHESHAHDRYNAFETYEKKDYDKEPQYRGAGTSSSGRTYTHGSSESSAGDDFRRLTNAVKGAVSQGGNETEADNYRVLLIILSILIPVLGFILGLILMKANAQAVPPARRRTGKIMVIASVVSFIVSQVAFPIIGGLISLFASGFGLL